MEMQVVSVYEVTVNVWKTSVDYFLHHLQRSPKQALVTRAQTMMGIVSPSIAYLNNIGKWDDHSFHAGETIILAVAKIIRILSSRTPKVLTVISRVVLKNWSVVELGKLGSYLLSSYSDSKRLADIIAVLQATSIPVSRGKILNVTKSRTVNKDYTDAQNL